MGLWSSQSSLAAMVKGFSLGEVSPSQKMNQLLMSLPEPPIQPYPKAGSPRLPGHLSQVAPCSCICHCAG